MTGALKELATIFEVLSSDVDELSGKVEKGSPQDCRSFVRAVFALIEGVNYRTKQVAISESTGWTAAELAMLKEEAYSLDNQGRIAVRSARIALLPNIRFTFDALSRSFGVSFELRVSGRGWEALQRAVQTRDRLMHPKAIGDLNLSASELANVKTAYNWFVANTVLCLKAIITRLTDRIQALGDSFEPLPVQFLDEMEERYSSFAE